MQGGGSPGSLARQPRAFTNDALSLPGRTRVSALHFRHGCSCDIPHLFSSCLWQALRDTFPARIASMSLARNIADGALPKRWERSSGHARSPGKVVQIAKATECSPKPTIAAPMTAMRDHNQSVHCARCSIFTSSQAMPPRQAA